jgi:hypothetical protein
MQGLEAGIHKQILYTGLRLGLYDYLTGFSGSEEVSMPIKIACATLTTGIGILIANPADVVQTRFIAYRSLSPQSSGTLSMNSTAAQRRTHVNTCHSMAARTGNQQTRQHSSFAANRIPSSFHGQRYMSNSTAGFPSQCQYVTGRLNCCPQRCVIRQRSFQQPVGCIHYMNSAQLRARMSHSACSVMAQNAIAGGPTSVTGVPLSSASRAYGVILRCVPYSSPQKDV